MEWQPGETAPKDGTVILALERGDDDYPFVTYWEVIDGVGQWAVDDGPGGVEVSHWLSIPNLEES